MLIHYYSNDHPGVATWRSRQTVTLLHALEARIDSKEFNIDVFSWGIYHRQDAASQIQKDITV